MGGRDLKKILFNALFAEWCEWSHEYPVHLNDLTLRDPDGAEVGRLDPEIDAIAQHFYKANTRKKSSPIEFKTGSITLMLELPLRIYHDVLLHLEEVELRGEASKRKGRDYPNEVSSVVLCYTLVVKRSD